MAPWIPATDASASARILHVGDVAVSVTETTAAKKWYPNAGSIPVTATLMASQAQSVSLSLEVLPGGTTYPLTVSASQGTNVLLRLQPSYLAVATAQATVVMLEAIRLPSSIRLTVTATVATSVAVSLRRQLAIALATLSQAQTVTSSIGRGFIHTVTAAQTQAVALLKQVRVMRRTTGTNRVETAVRLGRVVGRVLRASQSTAPRLVKQIRLTAAITQGQHVTLAGLPVQLVVISTVQTRSLDLGRVITLMRSVAQSTAAFLAGASELNLLVIQPTVLDRHQAVDLVRSLEQAQAVSLEALNVTPRYEILVTASVSQSVALGMSDTGAPARRFVVDPRAPEFVVGQRSGNFAVPGRRARFVVGVR